MTGGEAKEERREGSKRPISGKLSHAPAATPCTVTAKASRSVWMSGWFSSARMRRSTLAWSTLMGSTSGTRAAIDKRAFSMPLPIMGLA